MVAASESSADPTVEAVLFENFITLEAEVFTFLPNNLGRNEVLCSA